MLVKVTMTSGLVLYFATSKLCTIFGRTSRNLAQKSLSALGPSTQIWRATAELAAVGGSVGEAIERVSEQRI